MIKLVCLVAFLLIRESSNANIQANGNLKAYPTYAVSGIITLPYAEINEPFQAWYDETQLASRIDYYDGLLETFNLSDKCPVLSAWK